MRRRIGVALIALGVAALVGVGLLVTNELRVRSSYDELAASVKSEQPDEPGTDGEQVAIDWDKLRSQNPDIAAWVTMPSASIDEPVVQTTDNDRYVRHSLWGEWTLDGCPFLDYRSDADGENASIYGHHFTNSDTIMFSYLHDAHEQSKFDTLGKVLYSTPDNGTMTLTPIAAMRVYQNYAPIQTYDWVSVGDWRTWAHDMISHDATATSADWEVRLDNSTRCVSLICCSENAAGQPWRAIVICVNG